MVCLADRMKKVPTAVALRLDQNNFLGLSKKSKMTDRYPHM